MVLRRRRWLWVVGAIAVLAIGAGTTLWIQHAGNPLGEAASIDLKPAKLVVQGEGLKQVKATVSNDTGHKLTDAKLKFTVEDPGGDFPAVKFYKDMYDPECGIEDPGVEPECVKEEKLAKSQSCKSIDGDTLRALSCDGDIAKGDHKYAFDYHLPDQPSYEDLGSLADYPDLTIRATLTIGGTVVDTDKEQLSVQLDPAYGRVTVDDLPQDLSINDDASQLHDWSFTVKNNTDADITEATIDVRADASLGLVEIGTTHENCSLDPGSTSNITCTDVDIPEGESTTLDMQLNVADGAAQQLANDCLPDSTDSTPEECRDQRSQFRVKTDTSTKPPPSEYDHQTFAHSEDTVPLHIDD